MRFWTADLEMMIDLMFICRTWIGIAYASGEQTRGAVTHTPTRARALSLAEKFGARNFTRCARALGSSSLLKWTKFDSDRKGEDEVSK